MILQKTVEQNGKQSIFKNLEDNKWFWRNSQHGFVKKKSGQTSQISFSERMTSLDEAEDKRGGKF